MTTHNSKPKYIVEETSDAFKDPFILRNTQKTDNDKDRYYSIDGIYQTFETENEALHYAAKLNKNNK